MIKNFPPAVLGQHIAVLGKTGSGKTSTAKLIIEQVAHEGARVCVLDPIKSDWWGLTLGANAKPAGGLPFHILGGPRGHVPLHDAAGKAIAEVVSSGALKHSILDMADFGPGGQAAFFTDFAPALLRKMRGVLYLVMEEAHLFAPKERSGMGKENLSIHWAKTLAVAGRSKGIRLVVLTQRTQALHNAILGSCDTIIAHRLTAPADQEPVNKWLRANTDKETAERVAASLSSLKTGQGWLCSGEAKIFELRQFPKITTYDNSATPTDGDDSHKVTVPPVDQEALQALIGDAVKDAKANDPKELKKRIAELEKAAAVAKPAAVPVQKVDQIAMKAQLNAEYERGKNDGYHLGVDHLKNKMVNGLTQATTPWIKEQADALVAEKPRTNVVVKTQIEVLKTVAKHYVPPPDAPTGSDSGALSKGEKTILTALIQFPDGLRREQLTVLTTFARSTRDKYLQYLAAKGMVTSQGDRMVATEEGKAALPDAEPLPTGSYLREYWQARLPEGERKIFNVLVEAYPAAISRDELSAATGQARSTRDKYLQYMQNKQIVISTRTSVQASPDLFD